MIYRRGKPGMIVSDNGTELTSNAMFAWAQDNRVAWHFIAPGKPMQNGFCESFSGRSVVTRRGQWRSGSNAWLSQADARAVSVRARSEPKRSM